jgi:cytochrome bd ubiquinol oxidase subunit II
MMATLLVGIMVASLVLYALLGGADYGAGVWDLLSAGPLKEEQKELIANAIQPIWEANHVWLILIIVLLFSGFPPAFGAIMVALFIPILLMLAGIVLRGSSFVFRAYSTIDSRMQRACAYVFSMSSCFTPLFAGIIVGSLSDDHVFVTQDVSVNGYVLNWLNPFTVSVGLLTVAFFAFLAAAYLTVEASSEELKGVFLRRVDSAGLAVMTMAGLTSILSASYARDLRYSFMHNAVARWSVLTAGVAFALVFFALYGRRDRLLRAMAAIHIGAIVVGWASSQYPYLIRPQRTIFNSVLSETVVRDVVLASTAGAVVLFPSLGLLLYVFKDQRRSKVASSTEARP